MIIDKEEWSRTIKMAREKGGFLFHAKWEILKELYEEKMQEMAKTDPEIARIWKEYLKRRDEDETEKPEDSSKKETQKNGAEGR